VTIPYYYGLIRFRGLRTLILQDVGGVSLAEPAGLTLPLEDLSRLLQDCHRELHKYGVHQSDPQLGNFRLIDTKLMAIDFEWAEFDLSAEKKALFIKTNVEEMADRYQTLRRSEWIAGKLETA
jgi:tRNA A-37 threonylcarbamoyl transferase component Bud32